MHGILHLQGVEREVVKYPPERLQGDDVACNEGEAAFVRARRLGVLVVVECPCEFERGRTHTAEHGQFSVLSFSGALDGGDFVGVFAHGGQAVDLEGWETGHSGGGFELRIGSRGK